VPAENLSGHVGPGLIWGRAFGPEGAHDIDECDAPPGGAEAEPGFRWLHLNLAQQGTRDWIEHAGELPPGLRELLLSPDMHQRAVVEGGCVGCVIHDVERNFHAQDTERVGAIRVALTPRLVLTARAHPVRSADLVRQRLRDGASPAGGGGALDMLVGAVSQNIGDIVSRLGEEIRLAEDAFLDGRPPPTSRTLMRLRRRLAQLHRLLEGLRSVFRRLEEDADLPEPMLPVAEKLSQRLLALDRDVLGVQGQLRQLREEIDIQQAQRTNQNLYVLSIMTALLLPATLVTGIFGMNTGGMPFGGHYGTLLATQLATLLAAAAAWAAYALLRRLGFMRM